MFQQGQVFELRTRDSHGKTLWAYRYRTGGRASKRVQQGGFLCERDASEALGRALERLRREQPLPKVESHQARRDARRNDGIGARQLVAQGERGGCGGAPGGPPPPPPQV
jgi:hypothetical protein